MRARIKLVAAALVVLVAMVAPAPSASAGIETHSRWESGAYGYTYGNWSTGQFKVRAKDQTNNNHCAVAIMDWDMVSGHGDARAAMACGQWKEANSGLPSDNASVVEQVQKRATCVAFWGANVSSDNNCNATEGSGYTSVPIGAITTSKCIRGYYKTPWSNSLSINTGGNLQSCSS